MKELNSADPALGEIKSECFDDSYCATLHHTGHQPLLWVKAIAAWNGEVLTCLTIAGSFSSSLSFSSLLGCGSTWEALP